MRVESARSSVLRACRVLHVHSALFIVSPDRPLVCPSACLTATAFLVLPDVMNGLIVNTLCYAECSPTTSSWQQWHWQPCGAQRQQQCDLHTGQRDCRVGRTAEGGFAGVSCAHRDNFVHVLVSMALLACRF